MTPLQSPEARTIAGHRISLEPRLWRALSDISGREGATTAELVRTLEERIQRHVRMGGAKPADLDAALTSAVRVLIVSYLAGEGV